MLSSKHQPALPVECPVYPAARHANSGDLLAESSFQRVVPGDEAEAHPAVNHGEASAGELGAADQLAAKAAAGFDRGPVAAALGGHGAADAVDLAGLQPMDQIAWGADAAFAKVLRVAALDEDLLAAVHGAFRLQTEALLSHVAAAPSHQFLVEPGCTVMRNLPVQTDG